MHTGLGSSRFARRYSGNRSFFLFLQVLRCFSSLRLPHLRVTACSCWVPPFGNLRITAYLQLPVAYRCSSRPSSAPSAKASTVRPCLLNHIFALIKSLSLTTRFISRFIILEIIVLLYITSHRDYTKLDIQFSMNLCQYHNRSYVIDDGE